MYFSCLVAKWKIKLTIVHQLECAALLYAVPENKTFYFRWTWSVGWSGTSTKREAIFLGKYTFKAVFSHLKFCYVPVYHGCSSFCHFLQPAMGCKLQPPALLICIRVPPTATPANFGGLSPVLLSLEQICKQVVCSSSSQTWHRRVFHILLPLPFLLVL